LPPPRRRTENVERDFQKPPVLVECGLGTTLDPMFFEEAAAGGSRGSGDAGHGREHRRGVHSARATGTQSSALLRGRVPSDVGATASMADRKEPSGGLACRNILLLGYGEKCYRPNEPRRAFIAALNSGVAAGRSPYARSNPSVRGMSEHLSDKISHASDAARSDYTARLLRPREEVTRSISYTCRRSTTKSNSIRH
jgi:hypothetical protein